jgi:uncharacterized protein (TIGR02217 family)
MALEAEHFSAHVMYSATVTGSVAALSYTGQVLYSHLEGISSAYSLSAQVLHKPAFDGNVYSLVAQVLYDPPHTLNTYSFVAQVMFRADLDPETSSYVNVGRMDIEEEDVIYYDIVFPECISYGSTGVPRYETEKAEVLSGDEQRQTRWAYPKHEYSINMENLPANELSEIMNIWHVVRGDYIGFMFMDPLDHTSNNTPMGLSGTEVSGSDQFVAIAVGGVTDYEIKKEYRINNRIVQRLIKFPKQGTLLIEVDGRPSTQWTYNYDRCKLEWDVSQGATENVSVNAGTYVNTGGWDNLQVGDLVRFTGFANAVNNTVDTPRRVVDVNGSILTVENYNGSTPSLVNEPSTAINWQQSTPPTGAVIRSGYYFYVPVRFDGGADAVAEITAGLRETSWTSLGDIKLKEIFE